jgi:hypothetical protein
LLFVPLSNRPGKK